MSKKLAGTLFVRNGKTFDYCYAESIKCLKEFCDHVFILDAGSDDDTDKDILLNLCDDKTTFIRLLPESWHEQHGKEKLNYFTNIAIEAAEKAGYEYQLNLQADEIIHEKSYDAIIKAVKTGKEAFMCTRINLWKTPYHYLNVPHERKPCSTQIIRLAKTCYRSIGDAESIDAQCIMDYVNDIDIWHYGFVRKKEVMKSKVINMQRDVFGMDYDKKLDQEELFNPDLWFDPKTDLSIIDYPHPKIMLDWIKNRP
ncbi:MAG: hypothetical protein IPJ81_06890 [Chitinophagaceae bacterium]|nr:hypothetical protein [Chitinophagaceae bacterium]